MDRRTVLGAGGVLAATGVLAACGGSTGDSSGEAANSTADVSADQPTSNGGSGSDSVSAAQIPVGGGVVLEEAAVVVVQPEEGTFLAYTAVCPHQGCLVGEVVDNTIVCPCHDSLFAATDGAVIQGPALQGLTKATLTIDGDTISVA